MKDSLRILALNPHHGGSHKAFLDGWINHSRHEFDVLTLPPYKWKWRMRHAAVTFAEELRQSAFNEKKWDLLFCTDMLNLAEFLGLCPMAIRSLPRVVYFHENQLTYPNREDRERDLHFAFSNITTGLAADRVWFNSAFHRDEFLSAVDEWMRRMPDFQLLAAAETIRDKSSIQPPGIIVAPLPDKARQREDGADSLLPRKTPADRLRIAWVSRWEHDKDPQTFFAALQLLEDRGKSFRLNVLGESFGDTPPVFDQAKQAFAKQIDHWGYASSREQYERVLRDSDVVVSTAKHEFFGIGVLEAVAAGCFPLVPRALAYPEVLGDHGDFFHDGTPESLASHLLEVGGRLADWDAEALHSRIADRFAWPSRSPAMDSAIASLLEHD